MMMKLNEEVFLRYYNYRREDDSWDYKQSLSISEKSAFAEFAKDVLAFANFGGGFILLGVEDRSYILRGVQSEIDPSSLGSKIEKQLGFHLNVRLFYFDHLMNGQNIRLGLVHIPESMKVLMSNRDLHNSEGKLVVQDATIYYRRNTRSIRANGNDIDRILHRLSTGRTESDVTLQDELSPLRRSRQSKFDFMRVLWNNYDPTAEELGSKLREIWQFKSERSKVDFANLLHIKSSDIDAIFDGQKMLDLSHIVSVTEMFDLPTDYFFRPTFNMRFAYWTEDLVKHAILSLVKPKVSIRLIDNRGEFYAKVLHELATGICTMHDLLYSERSQITPGFIDSSKDSPWFLHEPMPSELHSAMSKQYYKLLEQYPHKADRSLMPHEHILQTWFFASDEYIARLVIEGIERIKVTSASQFAVELRFMKDLLKRKVRSRGYDSANLRMVK